MDANRPNPSEWRSVWERKGSGAPNQVELADLIAIDGFDTGAGKFPADNWLTFVEEIQLRLNINGTQRVLEVGCGAGAFLLPLSSSRIEVFGIDYSYSLVQLCRKVIPSGTFTVAEAKNIPFDDSYFDTVVSHSVFQYFESLDYAETVVNETVRVLKNTGHIALLDINDASKKCDYESLRREKLGNDEYDRLYGVGVAHQFYSKEWFGNIANNLNLECDIQDQNITGYENSEFKYNVFLSR